MWFLYDNVAPMFVAALCCVLAWLYGGIVASALLPTIPWLVVLLLEVMLCFPQRHAGETTYEARDRVWRHLKKDPLTWVVLVFLALLTIPFVNKGMCPACDYPAIHFDGGSEAPPVKILPFCVNRLEHLNVFIWFLASLVAMLAVKHALLRRGKRLVLELIVWNGLALAAVGMAQRLSGATAPLWSSRWSTTTYFFSTFGYPNMGGDYFTTLFGLAVALWRWNVSTAKENEGTSREGARAKANYRKFWQKHLMLVPAAIFFFCALMTLSRASIILVAILAIIYFVHAFTSFLHCMGKAKRVKAIAANLMALVLISTFFLVFLSGRDKMLEGEDFRSDLQREISTLDSDGILDRVSGRGQYHARVAIQVWRDNVLFGCGGWGYKHFCIPKMTEEDLANIQKIGGTNVHNDYLQFLAEHGLVGLALLVSMVVMLVWPLGRVWRALVASVRFMKPKDQPPRPIKIFALPASVFCILAADIATLVHALADCPLRSPAVLSLFLVSLAALDGFLPLLKKEREE